VKCRLYLPVLGPTTTSDSERTGEFIMPRGKVKWFNNAKGYGFIIEDGCSDDLFAHFSSVQIDGYKTLKAGQTVSFDKKPSDKGVHAVNIVPDEQAATSNEASDHAEYSPRAANG
jgi:CspA family cold shock protein